MKDTLLIFKLKIKSSYLQNLEQPADKVFDTLQFYAHGETVWRIRTYAVDQDLHIYQVNMKDRSVEEVLAFLATSTKEHYGDVMDTEYTLHLDNPEDSKTADAFFTEHALHPGLISTPDFAYWNPDGKNYTTQSKPL